MNDNALIQAIAQAVAPLVAQLLGSTAGAGAQQTQQGTQPQQAFGNPGGMQQAAGGTQNGSILGQQPPAQNTAQAGAGAGTTFGGAFGVQATPAEPTVTPDMIQQLITPLVQNEQIKQALTAQMQQMGINNLPDATPAQMPELYKRFKSIEEQAIAAGLIGGGAQQGGGTPSII